MKDLYLLVGPFGILILAIALIAIWFWVLLIPYRIAIRRGHRDAEAIKWACYLSFLFLGLGWPFAFIWAHTGNVDSVEPRRKGGFITP